MKIFLNLFTIESIFFCLEFGSIDIDARYDLDADVRGDGLCPSPDAGLALPQCHRAARLCGPGPDVDVWRQGGPGEAGQPPHCRNEGYLSYDPTRVRRTKHSEGVFTMLRIMLIFLTVPMMFACGSSLDTAKKFRDEKDKRLEAQKDLYESQYREKDLANLTSTTRATEHFIWAWRQISSSLSFDQAQEACQNIGFDLPTKEKLIEATQDDDIVNATSLPFADDKKPFVFVLDEPKDSAFALLCVKDR